MDSRPFHPDAPPIRIAAREIHLEFPRHPMDWRQFQAKSPRYHME
jgi:hypothetical protein